MNTLIAGPSPKVETQMNKPNSYPFPTALELHGAFNQFLIGWANLSAQYLERGVEEMSALPLEQSIYFPEPFSGLLAVRSTREFEKCLVELETGQEPGKDYHEKGLFLEMAVLYWHKLALKMWKLDTRTLQPAILKSSVPLDWPDRRPDTACMVFVKNFPLEILLWNSISEREMEYWKKPKK
jgi:hypothetical protein